uniref:Cryptonin n=1 Tax=Cryptotympana dubia TaxID=407121 RepID=CRYPT_CRYDU|nr:RecName: Full=Cryptonin [Cryptotympana dubia]
GLLNGLALRLGKRALKKIIKRLCR